MRSGHAGKAAQLALSLILRSARMERSNYQEKSIVWPGVQSLSPLIQASAFWLRLTVAAGPGLVDWATCCGAALEATDGLRVMAADAVLAPTLEILVIALLSSAPHT